jgi:hypothetical protein
VVGNYRGMHGFNFFDFYSMDNQIPVTALYTIISVLWFITVTAAGFIFSVIWGKVKDNTAEIIEHAKEIQHIKDVQGNKIDDLKKDFVVFSEKFDKLSEKVSEIGVNVHSQKNTENQLNRTLTEILRYLEKKDNEQH